MRLDIRRTIILVKGRIRCGRLLWGDMGRTMIGEVANLSKRNADSTFVHDGIWFTFGDLPSPQHLAKVEKWG